jgi:hypothetical protein
MKFTIYAAKIQDMSQGWVWLGGHGELGQRSIVRLSTAEKTVYCELLKIDENFIRDYNRPGEGRISITDGQSALVVGAWYRTRLGLQTHTDADIEVKSANHLFGQIRACLDHPQVVVRLPTWLGILSAVLGIIAFGLGVVPLFRK